MSYERTPYDVVGRTYQHADEERVGWVLAEVAIQLVHAQAIKAEDGVSAGFSMNPFPFRQTHTTPANVPRRYAPYVLSSARPGSKSRVNREFIACRLQLDVRVRKV